MPWPLSSKRSLRGLVIAGLAVFAGGCAPARPADTPREESERYINELDLGCAREVMDKDSVYRMPLAGAEPDPALARELEVLPYRARRVVLAAGLEPLLSRLLRDRAADSATPSLRSLAAEEELSLRLLAFDAQVSAAAFEADCTARRLQRLLHGFSDAEQSRQVTLAVTSLVIGASVGTVSGAWGLANDESDGPAWLAIAGGLVTTGIAAMALIHVERTGRLDHPRNRLTPFWTGSDPDHLYPTFVFRMLTAPDAARGRSLRDALVEAWRREIFAASGDDSDAAARAAATERLFAGAGGVYSDTQVALRAEMFSSIEGAIHSIARDVELANRSLVRVLTTALPTATTSPAPPSPPPAPGAVPAPPR